MSGGIDSSVAAALLTRAGHDVTGVTMLVRPDDTAASDAARVAERLGIPHRVIDLRDVFEQDIIANFCREYEQGRTPNPCVRCNRCIKFGALLDEVKKSGAEKMATGHYARLADGPGGPELRKGKDTRKDQSYFLCRLDRKQLAHVLFPVGGFTKNAVKRMAADMGLPTAERPESKEICFIPDDDYAGFLERHTGKKAAPGPVLDTNGTVLGEHKGITNYTVGQRHGLGIAARQPLYVLALDATRNAVIVGKKEDTYSPDLTAGEMNWLIDGPAAPFAAGVKIRSRAPEAAATVTPLDNDSIYVKFNEPQSAVTPGQTVALYAGDTVIGGGIIASQGR